MESAAGQFLYMGDQIVSLTVEEKGCIGTFVDTVRIYRRPETEVNVENQMRLRALYHRILGQHHYRWTSHLQLGFWRWSPQQRQRPRIHLHRPRHLRPYPHGVFY